MLAHSSFSFRAWNNCSFHKDDIIIMWPLLHCPPLQTKTTVETWTGTTFSHQRITHTSQTGAGVKTMQSHLTFYLKWPSLRKQGPGDGDVCSNCTSSCNTSCQSSNASGSPSDNVTLIQGLICHTLTHWLWLKEHNCLKWLWEHSVKLDSERVLHSPDHISQLSKQLYYRETSLTEVLQIWWGKAIWLNCSPRMRLPGFTKGTSCDHQLFWLGLLLLKSASFTVETVMWEDQQLTNTPQRQ